MMNIMVLIVKKRPAAFLDYDNRYDFSQVPIGERLLSLGFSCGAPVFDAMLAGYVINSQRRSFSLTALCADQQIPLNDDFPAPALLRLYAQQQAALQKDNLEGLLQDVEMPLSRVLFGMERAGVLTDRDALLALSDEFNAQIDALLGDIHK